MDVLHREMLELILAYIHPHIVKFVCRAWWKLGLPNWNKPFVTWAARNGYKECHGIGKCVVQQPEEDI